MFMDSQLNLFENEQDLKPSIVYQGGSLASRTALLESVRRLVTNVIYGLNTGESLAKLSRDGLWLKMFGDYCQARMDGSFEEYSEILPTWGLMLDGVLIQQHGLEPLIDESEFSLLPTPTASDDIRWKCMNRRNVAKVLHRLLTEKKTGRGVMQNSMIYFTMVQGLSIAETVRIIEMMMGLSAGYTDLNA
jgi:hypothetical protein